MQKKKNPWFEAAEAKTGVEADNLFHHLLHAVLKEEPGLATDHAKERVVANIVYVAGYYGEEARERVGRLYSHRSPYRNGSR